MRSSCFKLAGRPVHVYRWEPDEEVHVTGIVQLVHGSCEHAGRYAEFARFLTDQGLVVYANDHLGHGLSAASKEDLGYFGEHGGWERMVDDLFLVTDTAKAAYPGYKVTLLGHSMGSFMARHYAVKYGSHIDAVIASGTAHHGRLLLKLARFIASWEAWSRGSHFKSTLLYNLSYQSFNKRFQPARTNQDWLTRDETIVDEFMADEKCGFIFSASGFRDMFDTLLFITNPVNIQQTPRELPIMLLSGDEDPVGAFGAMVNKAYTAYQKAGMTQVTMKLYPGMRHEILNEMNRNLVYRDIMDWMKFHQLIENSSEGA